MARTRNKQLFNGLLDAVYCLQTNEPAPEEIFQPIALDLGRSRVKSLLDACANIRTRFHVLQNSFEKPCPNGLDQILKALRDQQQGVNNRDGMKEVKLSRREDINVMEALIPEVSDRCQDVCREVVASGKDGIRQRTRR